MSDTIFKGKVQRIIDIVLQANTLDNAIHRINLDYGEKGLQIFTALAISAAST